MQVRPSLNPLSILIWFWTQMRCVFWYWKNADLCLSHTSFVFGSCQIRMSASSLATLNEVPCGFSHFLQQSTDILQYNMPRPRLWSFQFVIYNNPTIRRLTTQLRKRQRKYLGINGNNFKADIQNIAFMWQILCTGTERIFLYNTMTVTRNTSLAFSFVKAPFFAFADMWIHTACRIKHYGYF
jgi:hypothetical protein